MPRDLHGLVYGAFLKAAATSAEQSQFRIRPEAAVFNPSTEKFILASHPKAGEVTPRFHPDVLRNLRLCALHHEGMNIGLVLERIDPFQTLQRTGD